MYSIYSGKVKDGNGFPLEDFVENFLNICENHQREDKACLFAFVIYDFSKPNLKKVLWDKDYFDALDELSGFDLSIFYLQTPKQTDEMNRFLKNTFEVNKEINSQTILFFQVVNTRIIDYFFCNLKEKKIEETFLEIQKMLEEVVSVIKGVSPENRKNYSEIFYLVEDKMSSIKTINTVKKVAKKTYEIASIITFISKLIPPHV